MENLNEMMKRGIAMDMVKNEAKGLLREYAETLETSKPTIVSNLTEFALEEAGIKLTRVLVWDQGSIDVDFGDLV